MLAVLENVKGIRKVMVRVTEALKKLGLYQVLVVPIDCVALGVPVSRPRYYFILIRRDVVVSLEPSKLAEVAEALCKSGHGKVTEHISSRMLPRSTPPVQKYLASTKDPRQVAGKQKWRARHTKFAAAHKLDAASVRECGRAIEGVPGERARDACSLLLAAHPGQDITAELSQNVDRASCLTLSLIHI